MKKLLKSLPVLFILMTSCTTSKFKSEKNKTINRQDSLSFELCQIYGLDQGIRNPFLKKNHINLRVVNQAIDTLSFDRIVDFVKRNGYPTKEILGEKNYSHECVQGACGAVLLHNPHRLANENEYFNLFLNEVKKGNLKAEGFALILDKYYWTKSKNKENRRVFYGSQFGKPCIQTKDETNKARVEIGLKPLNDDEFVDCEGEELDMPKERK